MGVGGRGVRRGARAASVPVLLSVGYAACHWCHVMAHESFEDEATAAYLNEHFVSVKVDREERPDVDAVYMEATQAMTGHGGWPMTVFATPEGEPFFCGTYFPPEPRHGMPSFRQLLASIAEAWRDRRDEVERAPRRIVAAARRAHVAAAAASAPPTADQLDAAVDGRCRARTTRRAAASAARQVPAVDGARVPAAPPRAHR